MHDHLHSYKTNVTETSESTSDELARHGNKNAARKRQRDHHTTSQRRDIGITKVLEVGTRIFRTTGITTSFSRRRIASLGGFQKEIVNLRV